MRYNAHPYQDHATGHIMANPFCGLFLDMGLGKTSATATALRTMLFDTLEADKVLVVAPKRVAETTWPDELKKWDHLSGLRCSVVAGKNAAARIKALNKPADIYTIGRDNVAWLVDYYGRDWPFRVVVLDELSSFKNPRAKRFKALRRVRPLMDRVVGLTGTPAPRSLLDLWSQIYLLDRGERFGTTVTGYRERFFTPGMRDGHVVYEWKLRKGAAQHIHELIGDICISMKAEDWLDLPKRLDQTVTIEMPKELRAQYRELERDAVLELDGETITAANAAGVMNKLAQFANGAGYVTTETGARIWKKVHDLKLEAVQADVEALDGEPILLFYQFQHDRDRLMEGLKEYEPRILKTAEDIADWNAGKIRVLLAHPASAGHGLNLQDGGHYCGWFGVTWDLELYDQAVRRLDRQGQRFPVINRRYLVADTVEFDMLDSLEGKTVTQTDLLAAVKARVLKAA